MYSCIFAALDIDAIIKENTSFPRLILEFSQDFARIFPFLRVYVFGTHVSGCQMFFGTNFGTFENIFFGGEKFVPCEWTYFAN